MCILGVEIITDPALLFLDEPTSGLDSYSAASCVKLFSAIAKRNAVVLCTIHQPASDVFCLFDQVIFMKGGRILYQGPVSDVTGYFSGFGYSCPTNFNPSDYVMTLSQVETFESLEASGLLKRNLLGSDLIAEEIKGHSGEAVTLPELQQASAWKVCT